MTSPPPARLGLLAKSAILVVDDNPHNLIAFSSALEGIDAEVIKSSSGEQALRELLSRDDFAVVVLDVQMPVMDGFETARLMRARQKNERTPIIFVTAYSRDDVQVLEAYKMGAVDFLFKPITPEVLHAKVSVFIDLRRRTEELRIQSEVLRDHQRREHARVLEEERHTWNEAAMRHRLEELAQADQRKDEFLAMLGHELRTPLAPIVTGLYLLKSKIRAGDDANSAEGKLFATVERQVHHLRRLVDDLLDISRINSGKIELDVSDIVITDLVKEVIASLREAVDLRHHKLEVRLEDESLRLSGDVVRLTQVVANLVQNALKYTDPGGSITVVVKAKDNNVEIAVSDNGTGIDAGLLPNVFDLFVQRRSGANGGLGVGLTLVKRLVELHKGHVAASSDGVGKGATFTVTLPMLTAAERKESDLKAQAPAPTLIADSKPKVPVAMRAKVAIVDDNEDIRETLRDLLEDWQYDVQCGADGVQGVDIILKHRPAVAFVDVGMPRMDGFQLARIVREKLGTDTTLVAMTGFGRPSDFRQAAESGFDGYLVKPIDVNDLRKFLPSK